MQEIKESVKRALGLREPWEVVSVAKEKPTQGRPQGRLTINFAIHEEQQVPCPECGRMCTWNEHEKLQSDHKDFLNGMPATLRAKVPRANCPEHGDHLIDVPWAKSRDLRQLEGNAARPPTRHQQHPANTKQRIESVDQTTTSPRPPKPERISGRSLYRGIAIEGVGLQRELTAEEETEMEMRVRSQYEDSQEVSPWFGSGGRYGSGLYFTASIRLAIRFGGYLHSGWISQCKLREETRLITKDELMDLSKPPFGADDLAFQAMWNGYDAVQVSEEGLIVLVVNKNALVVNGETARFKSEGMQATVARAWGKMPESMVDEMRRLDKNLHDAEKNRTKHLVQIRRAENSGGGLTELREGSEQADDAWKKAKREMEMCEGLHRLNETMEEYFQSMEGGT